MERELRNASPTEPSSADCAARLRRTSARTGARGRRSVGGCQELRGEWMGHESQATNVYLFGAF